VAVDPRQRLPGTGCARSAHRHLGDPRLMGRKIARAFPDGRDAGQ
jgi:hypothetical protein